MNEKQNVYVIDTNILIDYMDIIQDGEKQPVDPTIDLSEAHLVIPTIVIQELSKFKKEKTDRGKAARTVLRRLRDLTERNITRMKDTYTMQAPICVGKSKQKISFLPVHHDFVKSLPFYLKDDMDGRIIATAIAANLILAGEGKPRSWTTSILEEVDLTAATILTNDNGLAILAREYGLVTSRYGYEHPEPYTGRRDLVVPKEMLKDFIDSGRIELCDWNEYMPYQPELVANEFIIMWPDSELEDYSPEDDLYYSNIGRYDVHERAIVKLRHIRNFPVYPKNAGQAIYAEALAEPSIPAVICAGRAGSGKTYMATIYGYKACARGEYIGVTAIPCENHSDIGALPGDLDEKMDLDVRPMKNALRNYLIREDKAIRKEMERVKNKKKSCENNSDCSNEGEITKSSIKRMLKDRVDTIWSNWFSSIPIDKARGHDFSYEVAVYDEFQDQNAMQADTLVKRIGENGKMILIGDLKQIHSPYLDEYNNGLVYASELLKDNSMVAQVFLTEDDVVRHPLVKEIARRQARKTSRIEGDE